MKLDARVALDWTVKVEVNDKSVSDKNIGTTRPGTTGLIATFEYSNNAGVTWTYTPVGGAGGAPAGYDRNVTNVRWRFAGNLSHLVPNHTGSVGFTVRVR